MAWWKRLLPAIGRVLDGAAAEREIDWFLRRHRALGPLQRTAVVEAVSGGPVRRRLRASGSERPRALLFALLRDLSLVPEQRAAELTALAPPLPPRSPAPSRIAERWSYPDWIEAVFLRELGADAEASPPRCARRAGLPARQASRIDREALARLLERMV